LKQLGVEANKGKGKAKGKGGAAGPENPAQVRQRWSEHVDRISEIADGLNDRDAITDIVGALRALAKCLEQRVKESA
jgi:hypothetical protein